MDVWYIYLCGQVGGPCQSSRLREVADCLLRDCSIPDGVKVGLGTIECNIDQVATNSNVLHVQRLVDISDEVDHPLQCFLLLNETDRLLDRSGRVVGNGGDDATLLWTIPLIVDVA